MQIMNNNNSNLPNIIGQRVIIRLPDENDIDEVIKYYQENKNHLAPYEPIKKDDFYTKDYWSQEIRARVIDYKDDRSLKMFILDKTDSKTIIGVVNLNQIVRGAFHACYLGYSLAETKQGHGYMTESLKLAIDFVFDKLNIHRVMANYIPHNQKSGKVLKRLGFAIEGYARDYLLINGNWEDHILTSLSNKNWKYEDKG